MLLEEQISAETTDESPLPDDVVSASLDVLVSPAESSDDDPPPPLPPPPQEITRITKNNNIRRKRIFFIFPIFVKNNLLPIAYLSLVISSVFSGLILVKPDVFSI